MGTIVSVLSAPICDDFAGSRHEANSLIRGGTKVWFPAVNEGYFDESRNLSHYPLEVAKRAFIDDSREPGGVAQSGDARGQIRAPYNKEFVYTLWESL